MKKLKIFLAVLLASLMALSVNPKYIKADDINVVKEGTVDTFINNIPVEEIDFYIDFSKISTIKNENFSSTNPNLQLLDVYNSSKNAADGEKEKAVVYKNTDIKKGDDVKAISGSFTVIHPNAVIFSDGSRGDLQITCSDIHFKIRENSGVEQPEYFWILNSNSRWIHNGTFNDELKYYYSQAARDAGEVNANNTVSPANAIKQYSTITITALKDGQKVDGTFAYGLRDLDIVDEEGELGFFSEGVELLENFGDTVYMPSTNFLNQSGTRFFAHQGDDGTYNSGFIILAESGLKYIWYGQGNGMGTSILDKLPLYYVENSAINGTSKVVINGEKVEKPFLVLREGETAVISTSPNEGFKAKSIRSDGEEQEITDPEFDEFSLTYSNIKSNHIFIAEYEPLSYKINYDAGEGGEGEMTPSVFTFDMDKFMNKDNEFTKDHYKFIGFKLEGREELITTPEDFREILVEMGDGAEITLVAQWEYEQITSFIDIETEETISPDESGQIQPKDIDGYVYIETEADGEGNWVHKYKAVKTNYIDEDGTALLEPKPGKQDPEKIPGYKLVKTEDDPKGDTTYTYHKVKTSWVDETGKVLHPAEDGTLDPKVFPGYKLTKTETKPNGDVVHIYHQIHTSWIDEKGTPIISSKVGEHVKEEFTGYEFVRTTTSTNGDIIHHYDKLINLKFVVDGKTVKEENLKRGSDGTAPANPTKNGYVFNGWDKEYKNIQVDTVVNAKFDPIKYNITYVLDGGTNDKSNPSTYTIEDAITIKNPSKAGYKFLGWKEGNSIAKGSTGDKTFTAQWEAVANPVNTGFGNKTALTAVGLVGALSLAIYFSKKKFENK